MKWIYHVPSQKKTPLKPRLFPIGLSLTPNNVKKVGGGKDEMVMEGKTSTSEF